MSNDRTVWVSGIGRIRYCARCRKPEQECICRQSTQVAERPGMPRDGIVRLARDRKGRNGKTVTIVTGLPDDPVVRDELGRSLRKLCGAGGTTRNGVVEIQGDHVERLYVHLVGLGYQVKRSGG